MKLEDFKKRIWNHFGLTLALAAGFSLAWEFGVRKVVQPAAEMFFSSTGNEALWFQAAVHIGIVLLAMLCSLPILSGGVEETGRTTITELRKTERRYKSIVESTNDLIFQLDHHGIIVFANPAARLLGYEEGELIGMYVGELLFMDDKEKVLPRIMTKRVGHRATYHLPVQLATSPESVICMEVPAIEFALDACGLWEEPDEQVQTRGAKKTFIGTLCIARPVIKPEDLQPREEADVY